MIIATTIILSILVGVNFLLLKYSCNKITKHVEVKAKKERIIIRSKPTIQSVPSQLAPTGSLIY